MDTALPSLEDRLAGALLGTALGDALGLPAEGLAPDVIARRFGALDRFHLIGRTGFVSDDTEQSALVAQSLARHPDDPERCERAFGLALVGWFARLPWGIGFATLRACLRRSVGLRPSGVWSAGNGAAMRAAPVGVAFARDPGRRQAFGRLLAEVTHRDPRAVEGALVVAEVAALAAVSNPPLDPARLEDALSCTADRSLRDPLARALEFARAGARTSEAARVLGTSGFVVHTVPFALFVFARHGADPHLPIVEAIRAGGDTDSIGAIVGAWTGALHGEAALGRDLLGRIHDGPFGPSHLRALAAALAGRVEGRPVEVPTYSWPLALARNLALYPVVLAHALRRLVPL